MIFFSTTKEYQNLLGFFTTRSLAEEYYTIEIIIRGDIKIKYCYKVSKVFPLTKLEIV